MDYLYCKDLPVWAQILVGLRPEPAGDVERNKREKPEKTAAEVAHAA